MEGKGGEDAWTAQSNWGSIVRKDMVYMAYHGN